MRIFDIAQWMRITYLEGSSFCVEMKGTFVKNLYLRKHNEAERRAYQHRRQRVLLSFVRDYRIGFEQYYINNTAYNRYQDFVAAIRNNEVQPTKGVPL